MSLSISLDRASVRQSLKYAIPGILIRASSKGGFASLVKESDGLGVEARLLLENSGVEVVIPLSISPPASGEYKSIKWTARVENSPTPSDGELFFYLIGMEAAPGFRNGIALVKEMSSSATYRQLRVSVNGSLSSADISFDESADHEYELRWYSDHVEIWIDGSNAGSVDASPAIPLVPFMELGNTSSSKLPSEAIMLGMKDLYTVLETLADQI